MVPWDVGALRHAAQRGCAVAWSPGPWHGSPPPAARVLAEYHDDMPHLLLAQIDEGDKPTSAGTLE